ncbi:hypothetical protein SprV_0902749400 [Sparganum proliferum]
MMACVTNKGTVCEGFVEINGVDRGCIHSPTFFILMFSVLLMEAYCEERPEIRIASRADRYLPNSRCMQAPQKRLLATTDTLYSWRTAAPKRKFEGALTSSPSAEHQHEQNGAHASTVTQHRIQHSRTNTKCKQLETTDKFAYLGSILLRNIRIDNEVAQRISKASQTLGQLQASVWNRQGLQVNTKLKIYKAIILTTLL